MSIHANIHSTFTNTVVVVINGKEFLMSSFCSVKDAEAYARLMRSAISKSPKGGYTLAPLSDLKLGDRESKFLDVLLTIHKGEPTVIVKHDTAYIRTPAIATVATPVAQISSNSVAVVIITVLGRSYVISTFKNIGDASLEVKALAKVFEIANNKFVFKETDLDALMNLNAVTMDSLLNLQKIYDPMKVTDYTAFVKRLQVHELFEIRKLSMYAANVIDNTEV